MTTYRDDKNIVTNDWVTITAWVANAVLVEAMKAGKISHEDANAVYKRFGELISATFAGKILKQVDGKVVAEDRDAETEALVEKLEAEEAAKDTGIVDL